MEEEMEPLQMRVQTRFVAAPSLTPVVRRVSRIDDAIPLDDVIQLVNRQTERERRAQAIREQQRERYSNHVANRHQREMQVFRTQVPRLSDSQASSSGTQPQLGADGQQPIPETRLAYEHTFTWEVKASGNLPPFPGWSSTASFPFQFELEGTNSATAKLSFKVKDDGTSKLEISLGRREIEKKFWLFLCTEVEIEGSRTLHLISQQDLDTDSIKLVNTYKNIERIGWKNVGANTFLTVRATVRLYAKTLDESLKKLKSSWANFSFLLEDIPGNLLDVKILTKESEQLSAHKLFLIARSPVLRSMLTGEMEEGITGVIKMDDLSSKAVRFLLHFFYTGELLPYVVNENNAEKPCISELIYAAHKYMIKELLECLEEAFLFLCTKENVSFLLRLANTYSLRKGRNYIEKRLKVDEEMLPILLEAF